MSTNIRAKLSTKNKYWIDKHRYYELKHFCLQYPEWKKIYNDLSCSSMYSTSLIRISSDSKNKKDLVSTNAFKRIYYKNKMDMIESAASKADPSLCEYILKGVTEELSYTCLESRLGIPCSKDTYYDRYRRFFWILDNVRK